MRRWETLRDTVPSVADQDVKSGSSRRLSGATGAVRVTVQYAVQYGEEVSRVVILYSSWRKGGGAGLKPRLLSQEYSCRKTKKKDTL